MNYKEFNSQKGFTLMELVVVIVILGILAATVAPKFINVNDDAANATLRAMKGTVDSALSLAYAQMVIENKEGMASAKPDFCQECDVFSYGYPTNAYSDMPKLVENMTQSIGGTGEADWLVTPTFGGGESWIYTQNHADRRCYLIFTPATILTNKKYALEIVECE